MNMNMNVAFADKYINSKCCCNKSLTWINDEIILLNPCYHIFHKKCFENNKYCPICKSKVKKIETTCSLKKSSNINDYQRYVDIISVSNFDHYSKLMENNSL